MMMDFLTTEFPWILIGGLAISFFLWHKKES